MTLLLTTLLTTLHGTLCTTRSTTRATTKSEVGRSTWSRFLQIVMQLRSPIATH